MNPVTAGYVCLVLLELPACAGSSLIRGSPMDKRSAVSGKLIGDRSLVAASDPSLLCFSST